MNEELKLPSRSLEDNSRLVITKHRALCSKASELRILKSFTFSKKTDGLPKSIVTMAETQVTEIVREIESIISNEKSDYSALKRLLTQIPKDIGF